MDSSIGVVDYKELMSDCDRQAVVYRSLCWLIRQPRTLPSSQLQHHFRMYVIASQSGPKKRGGTGGGNLGRPQTGFPAVTGIRDVQLYDDLSSLLLAPPISSNYCFCFM